MEFKCVLAKYFKKLGINTVFSLPAYYITGLMSSMRQEGVNIIEFASEFSAISAAYAYSVISNTIGMVLVNTGPSFMNILTGLKTAEKDGVPIIVLVGCQEPLLSGDESYFQTINIWQYYKYCFQLTEDSLAKLDEYIDIAFCQKAPVVIQIPYSLYNMHVQMISRGNKRLKKTYVVGYDKINRDMTVFSTKLSHSARPMFILGKGAVSSAIPRMLEEKNIPFVSTLLAKKALSIYRSYMGTVGILGDSIANNLLKDADAVVCVGCRLSERTILNDKTILHNKDVYFINDGNFVCRYDLGPDHLFEYHYDAELFLDNYISNIEGEEFLWVYNYEVGIEKNIPLEYTGFTVSEVIRLIYNSHINSPIYCIDDGTYTLPSLKLCTDRQFVFSGSMAVGGFSLGAAIGSYYADFNNTPIVIIGDGGILSVLGELHTIKKYNIPVLIVVINNGGYESIRQWYSEQYDEIFSDISFEFISKAFNLQYSYADTSFDLDNILSEKIREPKLIEVSVVSEKLPCHFRKREQQA